MRRSTCKKTDNGLTRHFLSCDVFITCVNAENVPETENDGQDVLGSQVIYDLPTDGAVMIPENDCFEAGVTLKVEQINSGSAFDDVAVAMLEALATTTSEVTTTVPVTTMPSATTVQDTTTVPLTQNIPVTSILDEGSDEEGLGVRDVVIVVLIAAIVAVIVAIIVLLTKGKKKKS